MKMPGGATGAHGNKIAGAKGVSGQPNWLFQVISRRLDQIVGGIELARALLGNRTHTLGQAAGGKFVGMILADQFAVGALDLGRARVSVVWISG
jgi:hypothetical protein